MVQHWLVKLKMHREAAELRSFAGVCWILLLISSSPFRHVTLNSEFSSLLDSNENTDFSRQFSCLSKERGICGT